MLGSCRSSILDGLLLIILSLLLLDRFDLLLHLVHLHICLLLLFHDLVHESGLVHSLGRVKAWSTLSVPLNLMLSALRDGTVK